MHDRSRVTDWPPPAHVTPGGIPLPASLLLALGLVIAGQQSNISYRFVSDFPFANRKPHALNDFERSALASLRVDPEESQRLRGVLGNVMDALDAQSARDANKRVVKEWLARQKPT